ncbi:MAG TPA: hypothetical protein G4N95_02390 [Anaerolineae bacterium]|nr:hypothetical protein [Anaerolineae bacterium]
MVAEVKRYSLAKPTLNTPFHIDFNWWQQNDREWRVHLLSCLCPEHKEAFADIGSNELVDWIDPDTAEVQRVDGLLHILINHCAKQEDFITEQTSLVEGIFRSFLASGNAHMTPIELSEKLHRPAMIILRTISGKRVYKGIRPYSEG